MKNIDLKSNSKHNLWSFLNNEIDLFKTSGNKLYLFRARLLYSRYKYLGGKKKNSFIENSYIGRRGSYEGKTK